MDSEEVSVLRYTKDQEEELRRQQATEREKRLSVPIYNETEGVLENRRIEPWRVRLVYQSSNNLLFYLHPELIDVDSDGVESVLLCSYCAKSVKKVVNRNPVSQSCRLQMVLILVTMQELALPYQISTRNEYWPVCFVLLPLTK